MSPWTACAASETRTLQPVGGHAPDPTPETKSPGNIVPVQRAILPQEPLRHEHLGFGIPFLIVRHRPGIPPSPYAHTRARMHLPDIGQDHRTCQNDEPEPLQTSTPLTLWNVITLIDIVFGGGMGTT